MNTTPKNPNINLATPLVYVIGAGALLAAGHAVGNIVDKPVKINTGCEGSIELPVTSREPLSGVYDRVANQIENQTKIRPTDTQIINGVFRLNFGATTLSDREVNDLKAGNVPDGRSVLLVPERCPNPTQQS